MQLKIGFLVLVGLISYWQVVLEDGAGVKFCPEKHENTARSLLGLEGLQQVSDEEFLSQVTSMGLRYERLSGAGQSPYQNLANSYQNLTVRKSCVISNA